MFGGFTEGETEAQRGDPVLAPARTGSQPCSRLAQGPCDRNGLSLCFYLQTPVSQPQLMDVSGQKILSLVGACSILCRCLAAFLTSTHQMQGTLLPQS